MARIIRIYKDEAGGLYPHQYLALECHTLPPYKRNCHFSFSFSFCTGTMSLWDGAIRGSRRQTVQLAVLFACTEVQRCIILHTMSYTASPYQKSHRENDRNGQRGMQPTRTCIGLACSQSTRGWLLACGLAPDFFDVPFRCSDALLFCSLPVGVRPLAVFVIRPYIWVGQGKDSTHKVPLLS